VRIDMLVILDGSASTDPDGHLPLTYGWQQTGGTSVILSSKTISHPTFTTPAMPTVLTFSLVVTDARGLRSAVADTVVITVSDQAIVGLIAVNDSPTILGQTTFFTATAMGSNITYAWDFGDGRTGNGSTTSNVYAAVGLYTARVTATNGVSQVLATTPVTIISTPISHIPVANAGPDQTVYVSSIVTLNGSASSDPDGDLPLTYGWTQIGGPSVAFNNTLSVTTFTAPGTPTVLTFTLTVTDTKSLASLPDTVVITVIDHYIYLPLVMRSFL